tara:strand:+ start:2131 stop:2535 length:405 start_codon:yes stop_codon:yes gene_type:complete
VLLPVCRASRSDAQSSKRNFFLVLPQLPGWCALLCSAQSTTRNFFLVLLPGTRRAHCCAVRNLLERTGHRATVQRFMLQAVSCHGYRILALEQKYITRPEVLGQDERNTTGKRMRGVPRDLQRGQRNLVSLCYF